MTITASKIVDTLAKDILKVLDSHKASKTPEKNHIKTIVDDHNIAAGAEVLIDGIGMSIPVEQFCSIDAALALPRAVFTANGIRNEIFLDTANKTAYVRRVREDNPNVSTPLEKIDNVEVVHIEKSAVAVVVVEEEKKTPPTSPPPTPSTTMVQGGMDAVTSQKDVATILVPVPQFQTGAFNVMNWSIWTNDSKDIKSVSTEKSVGSPINLRDFAFANEITSGSEINFRGATTMGVVPTLVYNTAIPETHGDQVVGFGSSDTDSHSATTPRVSTFGTLNFNEMRGETFNITDSDLSRSMGSTGLGTSETPFRNLIQLRGPGLFEQLGALVASFKQIPDPTNNPLFTQMVTPLTGLTLPASPALKPIFNDMHSVDVVTDGEHSRDSSDSQRQSQDEHHEQQDPNEPDHHPEPQTA